MPQQLKRLIAVFALLIGGLVLARHFLVPPTFGKLGHYRAAAVDSAAALPIRYAGQQVCAECHDDIAELKENSRHRGLTCEVCHGPAAVHADDPDALTPPAPRDRAYCPLCHSYDPARPTGFPQIEQLTHNPAKACIECHDPHEPATPHVPEGCSACHGEVARTKAISPHAQVPCSKCHEVPEEHKVNPRLARPSKPHNNTTCGGCHAKNSDAPPQIPRISMASHSEGYVCWQCHYPHHPEAK